MSQHQHHHQPYISHISVIYNWYAIYYISHTSISVIYKSYQSSSMLMSLPSENKSMYIRLNSQNLKKLLLADKSKYIITCKAPSKLIRKFWARWKLDENPTNLLLRHLSAHFVDGDSNNTQHSQTTCPNQLKTMMKYKDAVMKINSFKPGQFNIPWLRSYLFKVDKWILEFIFL